MQVRLKDQVQKTPTCEENFIQTAGEIRKEILQNETLKA